VAAVLTAVVVYVLNPNTFSIAPAPPIPDPYRVSGRPMANPLSVGRAWSWRAAPVPATTTPELAPRAVADWAVRAPATTVVCPVNVLAAPNWLLSVRVPAP